MNRPAKKPPAKKKKQMCAAERNHVHDPLQPHLADTLHPRETRICKDDIAKHKFLVIAQTMPSPWRRAGFDLQTQLTPAEEQLCMGPVPAYAPEEVRKSLQFAPVFGTHGSCYCCTRVAGTSRVWALCRLCQAELDRLRAAARAGGDSAIGAIESDSVPLETTESTDTVRNLDHTRDCAHTAAVWMEEQEICEDEVIDFAVNSNESWMEHLTA